jgi:hypothetical protein
MTAERPNRQELEAWLDRAAAVVDEHERYRHSAEYLGGRD